MKLFSIILLSTISLSQPANLQWGLAVPEEISRETQYLDNGYYFVGFGEFYRAPLWVAYYLSDFYLAGKAERTNNFLKDTRLENSPVSSDYIGTGYDRGHNAPAADFKRSDMAMRSTFLMSNISPQTPELNRKLWRMLEQWVRSLTINKEIWVISGNYFYEDSMINDINIPQYCYKAILAMGEKDYDVNNIEVYAFWMPNQHAKIEGTIFDYQITVDSLEILTGYDFFYKLPDCIEDSIEAQK